MTDKITIDGKDYDIASLSKNANDHIANVKATDGEITRLKMQLAIAQELERLPRFRRFGGNTAYIEGWGLYSELIPKEIGFYSDPYSEYGRLTSEMVIKTVRMGIPALVSRSGFTTWGVELARQAGLVLIGRMRGKRFVVLSGEDRIVFDQDLKSAEDEAPEHGRKSALAD